MIYIYYISTSEKQDFDPSSVFDLNFFIISNLSLEKWNLPMNLQVWQEPIEIPIYKIGNPEKCPIPPITTVSGYRTKTTP